MPPTAPPSDQSSSPESFERAIEEVEAIIRRIEAGEVGLEDSIVQYERGVLLLKHCRGVLDRVEQRVQDLTARMQAEVGEGPSAEARKG